MATGKSYYARPSYRFIGTDQPLYFSASDSGLEFDEADLYNPVHVHSDSTDFRRKISSSSRSGNKSSNRPSASSTVAAPSSLPINVPDWSKILREEYRDNRRRSIECDEDGSDWLDASGGRLPPHEFLAKTRMASFSVHEGVGRTLKGRDLSRVRNAIFEKIGFQD
ncbi:Protein S40-4 [Cardamine amara subsp. amara]|uniref:Protein S40-4 n=1 Tax=Cardamine amara subsp. amara TaxID=228776 RepID=A0ABD1B9P0_CARAN